MFYGRRVIESQVSTASRSPRGSLIDKSFQHKYCWYFLIAIGGGCLFFFIPSFYFLSQNYELFKNLAFDTHPQLIEHLERELFWLKGFFFLSFITVSGTALFLSYRVTRQLLTPIAAIEKHMYQVSAGKLDMADFYMNDVEDFKELCVTYEHLYKSLQNKNLKELRLLKKIRTDILDRDSYAAWKQLVDEKHLSSGIKEEIITSENVLNLSEFDQKRRAS